MVIGVNTGGLSGGDDEQVIGAFIEQTGVTFPVVMDEGQTAYYDVGAAISPFPVDVVVDQDGVIRFIKGEYDPDALIAAVTSLL